MPRAVKRDWRPLYGNSSASGILARRMEFQCKQLAARRHQNVIGTRTFSDTSGVSRVTPTPNATFMLVRSLKR